MTRHSTVSIERLRAMLAGSELRQFSPQLVVDRSRRRVFVERREIDLTALEFRLLLTLVEGSPRIVSYEQLGRVLWNTPTAAKRRLAIHVSRVRSKLGSQRYCLQTHRGSGYSFDFGPYVVWPEPDPRD